MPDDAIPYDVASVGTAGVATATGRNRTGQSYVADTLVSRYDELLTYLAAHPQPEYQRDQSIGLFAFNELARAYAQTGDTERAERYRMLLERHYAALDG